MWQFCIHFNVIFFLGEPRNRTCEWDLLAIYSGIKQELVGDKDLNSSHAPFRCNLCSYSTFLPAVLRQHMLTHSIERPYKCPICDKGFTQKGSVQLHMLHHTGERPHKCPVCQRCYSQKGSMRRHILQHLSKNSNKCPLCSEIFELRSDVETHLIQHTKKDSFFCGICQATFTSSTSLDEHNKIHHNKWMFLFIVEFCFPVLVNVLSLLTKLTLDLLNFLLILHFYCECIWFTIKLSSHFFSSLSLKNIVL